MRGALCLALVAALCVSVAGVRLSSEAEARLEQAPDTMQADQNNDDIAQNADRLKRTEKTVADAGKKQGSEPVDQATKDEAKANPDSPSPKNAAVRKHRRAREKHQKAAEKVKELESKLGMRKTRRVSKVEVDNEYAKYSQKERQYKRKHRFPAVKGKEQAVKRVYEIMHKTKDPEHTSNKVNAS